MGFTISKDIELDAGHRVPTHGSKCRHIHGHRYKVRAVCEATSLILDGEQEGMVLDFGFLKALMLDHIHDPCDHGYIAWVEDEYFWRYMVGDERGHAPKKVYKDLQRQGYAQLNPSPECKFYIIGFVPTAEHLAAHWFMRLRKDIKERSYGVATLKEIVVWETPSSTATFKLGAYNG